MKSNKLWMVAGILLGAGFVGWMIYEDGRKKPRPQAPKRRQDPSIEPDEPDELDVPEELLDVGEDEIVEEEKPEELEQPVELKQPEELEQLEDPDYSNVDSAIAEHEHTESLVEGEPVQENIQTKIPEGDEFPLTIGSKGKRVERLQVWLLRNYGWSGTITGELDEPTVSKMKKHLKKEELDEKTYFKLGMEKPVHEQPIIR